VRILKAQIYRDLACHLWGLTILTCQRVYLYVCLRDVRQSSHIREYISVSVRFDDPRISEYISVCVRIFKPHQWETISLYLWGSTSLTKSGCSLCILWGVLILPYTVLDLCLWVSGIPLTLLYRTRSLIEDPQTSPKHIIQSLYLRILIFYCKPTEQLSVSEDRRTSFRPRGHGTWPHLSWKSVHLTSPKEQAQSTAPLCLIP
jgi:hypothetical protein